MKKAILIVAALMLVISGVAAVSAYEAHVVNVKAKVENALEVVIPNQETEINFGTVFPEEWLSKHFDVVLSGSFMGQTRVTDVTFEVWAEDKNNDMGTPDDPSDDEWYPWMGDAMFLEINGTTGYIGPATAGPLHAQPALAADGSHMRYTLNNPGLTSKTIYVWLDVPVFADYYNELTDVPDKPRADWADALLVALRGFDPLTVQHLPSMILDPGLDPHGYWMGVDLKIQVVDIQ